VIAEPVTTIAMAAAAEQELAAEARAARAAEAPVGGAAEPGDAPPAGGED